jgi:hypothetical protein
MSNTNRNAWIAVIAGLLLICMCFGLVGGGLTWLAIQASASDVVSARLDENPVPAQRNTRTPDTSTPVVINREPFPTAAPGVDVKANDALDQIASAVLPEENLADLAIRYKGVTPQQAEVSCPALAPEYEVGATRTFTLSNQDDNSLFQITARLEYKTPHAYMWVQQTPRRVQLNASRLRRAADEFERAIYPTTREFFGSEAQPGVDCDPHVHVVHATGVGSSVGGYFSSPDAYPRAVRSDSNEGQMFVMHAERGYNGSDPGSETYMSTLAHEFQHMVSSNNAHTPDLWLEEGAAQLAERLNGYANSVTTVYEFAGRPEIQLNTWEESSAGANGAHYGGGYLFWSYLFDRFGEDITKKLARNPERSEQAFINVLADEGVTNPDTNAPFTFEELFADFVIANYMNRQKIEPSGNRYNYATIDVPSMATRANLDRRDYPFSAREGLAQFGTHYYTLDGNAPVTIDFTGSTTVQLLPTSEHDGAFWWSNRGDESNPRLTREVDLTRVDTATLTYRAWYRLEKDYDYAYVSVSEDGGATWTLLEPTSCTTDNPQNANLGCGYNGPSGGNTPRWVDEQADLSAYAGKKILLRFEMVTDAGVNREGLAIDNIAIPEIDWSDAASTDGDWQAEGWVRVENTLPQHWQVQLITTNRDGSRSVQRMPLTDAAGNLTLDLGGSVRSAVLAISPTTQVTTEPGGYELSIK